MANQHNRGNYGFLKKNLEFSRFFGPAGGLAYYLPIIFISVDLQPTSVIIGFFSNISNRI
jgi:hypothetical protein